MVRLWGDVDVFASLELQLPFAADNVSYAFDDDPMLAASRVSLETESRAGLHFK